MREGWNVLRLSGKGDGKEFIVVAAGVDRQVARQKAEKMINEGEETVYVVRASKVVVLDPSDMRSALPKGVI